MIAPDLDGHAHNVHVVSNENNLCPEEFIDESTRIGPGEYFSLSCRDAALPHLGEDPMRGPFDSFKFSNLMLSLFLLFFFSFRYFNALSILVVLLLVLLFSVNGGRR
jgi:hypothetical protein